LIRDPGCSEKPPFFGGFFVEYTAWSHVRLKKSQWIVLSWPPALIIGVRRPPGAELINAVIVLIREGGFAAASSTRMA
jgi:hypothetical protein